MDRERQCRGVGYRMRPWVSCLGRELFILEWVMIRDCGGGGGGGGGGGIDRLGELGLEGFGLDSKEENELSVGKVGQKGNLMDLGWMGMLGPR